MLSSTNLKMRMKRESRRNRSSLSQNLRKNKRKKRIRTIKMIFQGQRMISMFPLMMKGTKWV